jgi:hypothetical protein
MSWNLRECCPHPTYLLASVVDVFACLSKMHVKVPVCFNFFNLYFFNIIKERKGEKQFLDKGEGYGPEHN